MCNNVQIIIQVAEYFVTQLRLVKIAYFILQIVWE